MTDQQKPGTARELRTTVVRETPGTSPGVRPPRPGDDKAAVGPVGKTPDLPPERGGADGPEPTRYGDWAHKGRVTDF